MIDLLTYNCVVDMHPSACLPTFIQILFLICAPTQSSRTRKCGMMQDVHMVPNYLTNGHCNPGEGTI